jgi:1-deoxy-D-xylulose-5-phosphate reductoisomerase
MSENKIGVAILGSTGSIGTQTLDVIRLHPDKYSVELLAAGKNYALLAEQAIEFNANAVVIDCPIGFEKISDDLWNKGIKCYQGSKTLEDLVSMTDIDTVVTSMVGAAGLLPTIAAIKAKKNIALANKETLVVAGDIITQLAFENGVNIYPVDSEHSAIFQCLPGEWDNAIEKIILTASGGPFRGKTRKDLENITLEQALKHPNWSMGSKITIDSATLMNKGLEVIEAKWLFNCGPEKIDVVVHPESIVHSLVQFTDGSVKAQMGLPDMKLPIQYALHYPKRLETDWPRLDLAEIGRLNFEKPDLTTFTNLQLAYDALKQGGDAACVLNAVNEVTVAAFCNKRISFTDIFDINKDVFTRHSVKSKNTLEDYLHTDAETRRITEELINKR